MILMSQMKSTVSSLLDLRMEIKRRNTGAIPGSGYFAPTKASPLVEGLGLYDLASPQAVQAFSTQLDASPFQRETILRYSEAIHELSMDIGRKLGQSMGLLGDLFMGWPCQFRMNKYNFTTEALGSSVMEKKSGAFIAVDPLPGTFLVNIGDIATVWSNGRFYNVKHRVVCKEATIRVSIAMFVLGPREEEVEAPPELVDSDHPRLYVPLTFEDYRKLRLSTRLVAGEALEFIRTTNC
ncbi:hypothetical protein F0562_010498 [Nyssa sinensis]|uniref:Isopenicillin N synthase-like Fe(2+) 2OG dioxygenase domain-containing protein n=1 Tax=Nyssa sinensis TaxID=561372 RepID=A0A5J5A3P9_9ASTE|nr:hypothetical protein F0562_010498 [Nyssa sinensis]